MTSFWIVERQFVIRNLYDDVLSWCFVDLSCLDLAPFGVSESVAVE